MKTRMLTQVLFLSLLIASPLMAQRGQGSGQGMRAEFMEWKLQKDLGLNAEQVEKMKDLREKNQDEIAKIRDERMEAMKERRQEMAARMEKNQAEMKKILTPEQYEKWKTMRFEQMERNLKEGRRRNPGRGIDCPGGDCRGKQRGMNERPNRPQPRRQR